MPVAAYVDDRPIGPLENLPKYSMKDMHRVETYGYRGEREIRMYTNGYLRLVAAGLIRPDLRAPPREAFELPFDTLDLPRSRR